jgi:hypothetical protein
MGPFVPVHLASLKRAVGDLDQGTAWLRVFVMVNVPLTNDGLRRSPRSRAPGRLVNPADGPLGEHPGWNGVALPGLQGAGYSPLLATMILAPLVAGWHLPTFFLEEGALQPSVLVAGLVTTMAVTFWYAWLFNHTSGSILLLVIAHDVEGSIQYELGWIVMGVWLAVAIGLVVFDWKAWRGPAPAPATTVLQPAYEGESRVR